MDIEQSLQDGLIVLYDRKDFLTSYILPISMHI
jgi:hypothetical protein